MPDFVYCLSNPTIPGIVRVDTANSDPREKMAMLGTRGQSLRIDWVVRVADADASLAAMTEALSQYADPSWPGHYRCDPMEARAVAIQFTTVREPEEFEQVEAQPNVLPSLVLGLGLAVQFLGFSHGDSGPSVALIAAALFWVVHNLPTQSSDARLA